MPMLLSGCVCACVCVCGFYVLRNIFKVKTIGKYFTLLKIHVDLTKKLSSNFAISYFDCLPLSYTILGIVYNYTLTEKKSV